MGKYIFGMFVLCLFVWSVAVDNAVMPKNDKLKQDVGAFSRYRVKEWNKTRKINVLKDQLLIYAIVDNREQLYYMDRYAYLEATLKNIPQGTPVQLRYATRFPKFWKKHVYDIRSYGQSILHYSPAQLIQRQKEINKSAMVMGGAFLVLVVLGFINKPRRR